MSSISFVSNQSSARAHQNLKQSLQAMEHSQQCAVLWFGEIMRRRLFRAYGHSSINQYAVRELGFSKSRTDDFVRLARKLDQLPTVREAVVSGELGYTKAREIVKVATPETEEAWVERAKEVEAGFATRYPTAERVMREVIDALVRMGI